jgi:hypothetical protein
MKKPLYFIFALLFALALVSCQKEPSNDDDEEIEEPLTLDQRLVGGRWFRIAWDEKDRVYYFSHRYPDGNSHAFYASYYYEFIDTEFYSKDGIIYKRDNNQKLMSYTFLDAFNGDSIVENYVMHTLMSSTRRILDCAAVHGDLITYEQYSVIGGYNFGYLIRGTKYEDY